MEGSTDAERPGTAEVAGAAERPGGAGRLIPLNVLVGVAHLVQAVLIVAFAAPVTLPIDVSYLAGPPGSGDFAGPVTLIELRIDLAVAAFLALAAVDHLTVASPWAKRWYLGNVARGVNPARWWEYSVSASLMVVLIAMLTGISNAAALIALFGANAAMILFGLVMERVNLDRSSVDWRPFIYGCLIGAVPWLAISLQLIVTQSEGPGAPGFVIAIFVTLFILFNSFAVNMWLHYRARSRGGESASGQSVRGEIASGESRASRGGRWADPYFTERAYLLLSLIAKSALAWQVYIGALA